MSWRERTGGSLWNGIVQTRQAASPGSAYLVTSLLQGDVERGTASIYTPELFVVRMGAGKDQSAYSEPVA